MNLKKIKDEIIPLNSAAEDIQSGLENMISILEAVCPDIAITQIENGDVFIDRPLTAEEKADYEEFTGHKLDDKILSEAGWYTING